MTDPRVSLHAAWHLAVWAPDEARERIVAMIEATAAPSDEVIAEASEILGKIFAVTGAWDLATQAYEHAAALWVERGEHERARVVRAVAGQLPLAPFASDHDALAAELAIVESCQTGTLSAVERCVVDLRRALLPRPITGHIEAAFALAPEEVHLLMAAIGTIVDPERYPARTPAAWSEILAGSVALDASRLLAIGLCHATPALVPHPGVVSRVLGRDHLEHPGGVRLAVVAAGPPPPPPCTEELAAALVGPVIAVIRGPGDASRKAAAAAIAALRGWRLVIVHPLLGAGHANLRDAVIEAALFHGLIAIDLDQWSSLGVDLIAGDASALAARGPLFVLSEGEPEIHGDLRAFTIRTVPDEVRSPQ